jgi:hypothetical protein
VLEGLEGREWRIFVAELEKVVALSGGSSRQPSGGMQATGVGDSSSASMRKATTLDGSSLTPTLGGSSSSFAKVLGGMGKLLSCSMANGLRRDWTCPTRGGEDSSCHYVHTAASNKVWRVLVGN